jgi:hypothetical protein
MSAGYEISPALSLSSTQEVDPLQDEATNFIFGTGDAPNGALAFEPGQSSTTSASAASGQGKADTVAGPSVGTGGSAGGVPGGTATGSTSLLANITPLEWGLVAAVVILGFLWHKKSA